MADNNEPNDDEDFICIINENPDDTFELLEANYSNENANSDSNAKVKVDNLFPALSTNSILGTKSSNISLNLEFATVNNGTSTRTERSYSAESLNFISDVYNNHTVNTIPSAKLSKSLHEKPPPSELALFDQLQQWIYCIAVVNFDIEIGQSIEVLLLHVSYLKLLI